MSEKQKKTQVSVYLHEGLHRAVKSKAALLGINTSNFVALILTRALETGQVRIPLDGVYDVDIADAPRDPQELAERLAADHADMGEKE